MALVTRDRSLTSVERYISLREKYFSSGGILGSNGGGSQGVRTCGCTRARYKVLSCNGINGKPRRFLDDRAANGDVFRAGVERGNVVSGTDGESTKVNVSASMGHHKWTF